MTEFSTHDLRWIPLAMVFALGCGLAPSLEEKTLPRSVEQKASQESETPPQHKLFPSEFNAAEYPELQNLHRVTESIYSGAEPQGRAAFEELQRMGIRTIVSVDGAKPDTELATQYGLRYVHLPFGYDGIPPIVSAGLTRVARESPRPIYIHCHHGKHRGPAAVAIACIAAGSATGPEALEILRVAGTGENYRGLWRDVEQFTPLGSDALLPELVSVAQVDSLVTAMAQISRANDNLKILLTHDWKTPADHPDLVAATESTVLAEGFREGVRLLDAHRPAEFVAWLKESEQLSAQISQNLSAQSTIEDSNWNRFQTLCKECHLKYRDHQ